MTQNIPVEGDVWYHVESGVRYIITSTKFRYKTDGGDWEPSVLYFPYMKNTQNHVGYYGRPVSEFVKKFRKTTS